MSLANGQVVPGSPSQQTGGGGFWGGINTTLGNAFSYYLTYEMVKNQRNSTGADLQDKQYVTELPNGAAVMIDESKGTAVQLSGNTHVDLGGVKVPKVALYGAAALVVGALILKSLKG